MNISQRNEKGFTLIELLVVITIIAILATVATPMIGKARVSARMIPATKNVQNILTSMTLYSGDSGGLYPEGTGDSNMALSQLFPDYSDTEKIFYLQGDRVFCDPKSPPDEDYTEGRALEAGENHWAYVSGLTDNSKTSTPILADGFTNGIGSYDERNHVWAQPNKAIIGFRDGSATAMKLGEDRTPKAPSGDNLFEIPDIVEDDLVEVLNPLKRLRPGQ